MAVSPYLIITGEDSVGHPTSDGNTGPYSWNGAKYVVLRREDIANFETGTYPFEFIAVMKSVDNGVTWVEQDSANAPPVHIDFSLFYPRAGGSILYLACQTGNNPMTEEATDLALFSFDMATDSYSAIASTSVPSGGVEPAVEMVKTSDDTFVIQYVGISGDLKVYGISWNLTGGWTAPVQLSPSFGNPDRIGITDADTVHLLWYDYDMDGRPDTEFDSIWTSFGGFAAPITAWTGRRFDNRQNFGSGANLQGKYVASTDEILFSLPNVIVGPAVMSIGTPNGTPSFTRTTAWFTPPILPSEDVWADISVSPDESLLTLFFTWTTFEARHQLQFVTAPVSSGPWSEPPSVYWDEEANPPVPPPPIFSIDTVSARYLDGGTRIGVVAGAWSFQGAENQCEVQYYLSSTLRGKAFLPRFQRGPMPQ